MKVLLVQLMPRILRFGDPNAAILGSDAKFQGDKMQPTLSVLRLNGYLKSDGL
jgi:hypothetical protein